LAFGLAATAAALCLLSAALPAYLAGDARSALTAFGLLSCASGAAFAAWSLCRKEQTVPVASGDPDGLRLLEGVAGALRDGLNTIRGFSELLVLSGGAARDGPDFRNACRFIFENSADLTSFVANLQDFVRYEQGRLRLVEQQVDAAELIEAALGLCRGTAERADVVIVATLLEGLELRCDAFRVRGAVANMVLWAAGSAPPGSKIAVRFLRLPGGAVALAVSSLAKLPRAADGLFEPRFPLDGLNGLALPIARRVALLHSGDLTIDGGCGAGSTARFILPPHRVMWPERAETRENRAA
jgi:signal transduction histidine kinase